MRAVNPGLLEAVLFCILVINAAKADICKRGCPQSEGDILKFQPGHLYEYNFDSVLTVALGTGSTTAPDDTSLKLIGTAKVFAEGNCGYTLQLSAVKVSATKEAIEKKIVQNIQKPVHFILVNGKVEPQLCTDPNDNQYALNIKRAIISLLQSNTEDGAEVDVFGQCTTHTSVSNVAGSKVVTKVRDLNNCIYRENTRSSFIHGVVNQAAGVKSAHLFKAGYVKESKIVDGIVESVHLVEDYNFGVAEKDVNSIRGKVITNLKIKNLAGITSAAPQTGNHGVSIFFQKPETYATKNLAALKTTLIQLVNSLDSYVKKDSAKGFIELIHLMRNADTDTLLELAAVPHANTVLTRKVYLDALFRTGTSESVKSIFKQFNKMNEQEKFLAIISLNLVQTVDKETLSQSIILLTPTASKHVYLSIGSLVSKYCLSKGCVQGDLEVITKKFIDNLKHCKANTRKDEDRIVNVLKGIANMKHTASNAVPALADCASSGRSNRIRVAALQAFSSAKCDSVLTQKALALLRDRNEDSELRIESYLAAIDCPNANVAIEIADIVNSEEVHQVGGFIASSLRAIRDSTDDHRALQRYHLSNIRITKHFPKDLRRYSYNDEISYRVDALGISASSDYKLIYSQHGFLPRSATLNVTTEIFGTNFNVFEVSARQENLENILEYYIGPKGLLNKDFDEIIKMVEEVGTSGDRSRRSLVDDTTKFSKKYKTYGNKNIQDVNIDLSLKFFGSEMLFLSLGDHIPSSLDDIIKSFSSVFDNLKKELLSLNKEYTLHDLFLDVNAIYPTGLGIPLELNTQGFTANKLEIGISLDIDSVIEQNYLATKYQVKLVPSVDVNFKLQLGFSAYILATGLQVELNLHSASGADVKFVLTNEGNGFNVDIHLPRNKLELINVNVNHGFYITELDKPTKVIASKNDNKQNPDNYQMCFKQLDVIGINLCVDAAGIAIDKKDSSNSADIYNLIHPVSLSVYTETEKNYNLRGSYIAQTNSGSQEWKVELSTPGSREPHTAATTFEVGTNPRTYARLAFDTPLHHFALESGFNNDNQELVFYAQYEDNDKLNRNRIGFLRNGNEYRPVVELQDKNGVSNEIFGYRLDGKVFLQKTGDKQAKYIFDNLQVSNKQNELVVLNGWSELGPSWLINELRVGIGKDSYLVKSNFKVEKGIYDFGFFINDEQSPHNVYGSSAHVELAEQVFVVNLVGAAASWNVDISNEVQYTISEGSNDFTSCTFKHDIALKNKNNIVGKLKLRGQTSGDNKLELETELIRGKRVAAISIKYDGNRHALGDYIFEVHGKYNKHFADIIAKCDLNGNRFLIDNSLATSWGTSVTVKGELGQRFSAQDIYIDVHGIAQLNKMDKQLQWILKVIGAPEKTNSELKISRDNAEILKYSGELQHPQDKISSGKINISVKNIAVLRGDYKIAKNGKGESNIAIESLKSEQKHKVDINSKFQVQAPKYELEATIIFDDEKKIFLKTENNVDKVKFVTKNLVEISNQKASFDANVGVKGDWHSNGELQGNFVLTIPTGSVVDGNVKRKISTNSRTGNIHGDIEVEVSETHNNKKRTLAYSSHVDKLNLKTKEISQNSQLTYTDVDNKKLELSADINHLPKDQSKFVDIKSKLRGDILNIPIDANFVVDEYDKKHAVFRIDIKSAGRFNYNVNGRYNLGGNDSPATFDVESNIQLPKSTIQSIHFSSNGKLVKPSSNSGTYLIELHVDERFGDNQFLRLNTISKGSQQQGAYTFDFETKEMQGPLKLEGTYQNEHQGDLKDGTASGKERYSFNFNYNNKFVKTAADLTYVGFDTAVAHYTLDSSFESAKNIDVDLHLQKLEVDTYELKCQARSGNNIYASVSKTYQSQYKKGLDIQISVPNGSPIVIVGIIDILGEYKAKITVDIQNVIGLDLTSNIESTHQAINDFFVKANWNSIKLNLENYNLDVRSQDNFLIFNLKNAKGVIFAGSATYTQKKEKNKTFIEGQGQMQYQGKTQKTNFRLIHHIFDINMDKEVGFSYALDGNFGPKKGVSTLKITNKGVDAKLSICEDKKQCTNVQLQSIVSQNSQGIDSSQNSLLIVIDLRELGYPYEFEFQSKTIRRGLKLQYSLESQIVSNNNLKYMLVADIQPTNSNIQLKLPHRELLLEVKQQFPEQGKFFGHYENSLAFFFDKTNKPNDVTRFKAVADITGNELTAINLSSEIKFEHPTIRPLAISGKVDANGQQQSVKSEIVFDIFRLPEQKIIVSLRTKNMHQANSFNITTFESLYSKGLGFNYEFSGHTALNVDSQVFSAAATLHSSASDLKVSVNAYGTKDHCDLTVYVLNEPMLQIAADYNKQKYAFNTNSKLQLFSQAPIELITDFQPMQVKFIAKRKGLIDIDGDVKLGKELKLNLQATGKQLFSGRIALDARHFLQTSYSSNSEDIKSFLNAVESETKKDTEATVQIIKNKFKYIREAVNQQAKLLKDSTPDLSQLKNNYEANVNEIAHELENDPALKQISESCKKIYAKFTKVAGDLSKNVAESYENLYKSVTECYVKLESTLKETVLPAWENLLVTTSKVLGDLRLQLVNFITELVQDIWITLEQYGPALKNYGKVINDSLNPLIEAFEELVKVAVDAIEDIFEELKEYLTKLPSLHELYSELKEHVKKLRLAENALQLLNDVFDQLHILPLTPESNEFFEKLREYTKAKLTNNPVSDEQVLQDLTKLLMKALRSVWTNLNFNSPVGSTDISDNIISSLLGITSELFDIFDKLPSILSFRFSVFNFLLNENWENLVSEKYLKSWIFFNDFNLHGHISDGHHIFTFDGQHYSFPGSCKYILTQDSVDNNFTVVAHLNNGKLKAIILIDRDGIFAEISDSAALKINGKETEFPQHFNGIHAWRLFYTIWLYSEYGVEIMCTHDLKICNVKIDGFYTSKTRGLLGNANAEPYDDLIQVDGTIAQHYASFSNGYGIGKCVPITAKPADEIGRSEICTEIFSLESPLTTGYIFENPAPYRSRCDAAVAEASEKEKEAAACLIATAYGSALKLKDIPTQLPSRCLKCSGAAGQRELGKEFTVKIPNNKADIVFVVDLEISSTVLSNFVAPVILEVRDSLKTRGFTDVQIGVIAYNETQRYPAVLTSDGGKINYKGNLNNVRLNGPKNICLHCLSQELADPKVVEIFKGIESLFRSTVPQSDEKAFRLALNYPFRAGSAKSIVGVRSNTLDFVNLFKLVRAHLTDAATNFNGALLHLIGPVNDLSVENIPKEKLVGFNSRLIATLDGKDAKKRQKLQFRNDIGIDFALNNGGWVFTTENFDQLKPNEQKKALNQVVNTLADTLFRTEIVSECECEVVHGLHAQHRCVIKSSNFLPNKKLKAN
ncbi:apolipophorins [Bactrocera dorsalis]|uniref:Apolipophorins n=3 Tax=Endopterygota TaxID=33392 RepID=A0A034VGI4_BACDO|nr:apolipophorins [Bactrocera dorsalis]XP_029405695.1 apolipophorins [Bactrocera dorsalis]